MDTATQRLFRMYEKMLLIRRFEEASAKAYATGKIRGFCHLYIGEEPVAVGAIENLEKQDYVICTYREHGHALARGMSSREVMAELFGKATGCSKGLGGSMHLFSKELNFMGGHGIVGGHIAVAAGHAFASKYRRDRAVTLCFIGEGGTNIGSFYEGLTYASLWNLPVVYIIENNLYAMGTPIYRAQPTRDLTAKARAFNMPSHRIDALDVELVYNTVREAVVRARSGQGPSLIEAITYRFRGHSMSDPAKYRPPGELEEMKEKDPLDTTRQRLLQQGFTDADLQNSEDKVIAEVEDAVQYADASPELGYAEMQRMVYASLS
ncbi:MAG TPA: pyruvate dehydrogenase (acetyl-transferring) E1 component subunit alpha [Turneriella sp.]|nr:pyruvate dehydrogenase (acetyl-transferring) E1 component subunit alpha [Turneriella sp.]HNE20588.1 pyruvate dehydrogenase (acetyl-transferring) E1 component subunit alpha [Turneriella sp.]HNL53348.1 pyruvate dehydrogenase (acetyl-transferring) E1 component subunit alpha [Turneriella sp.]HNM99063.1 pyruvate dehydrogenase (acetyl-transferring) E1 component subunit alpha [Turneriella sp.]